MPARVRKPATVPEAPDARRGGAAYFRGLQQRNQVVAEGTDPLPPGVTHVVEVRKGDAKRVKRKRFS